MGRTRLRISAFAWSDDWKNPEILDPNVVDHRRRGPSKRLSRRVRIFRDEAVVEVERGAAGCNQVRAGLKQTVILPDAQRFVVKALLDCLHAGSMYAGRQDFL